MFFGLIFYRIEDSQSIELFNAVLNCYSQMRLNKLNSQIQLKWIEFQNYFMHYLRAIDILLNTGLYSFHFSLSFLEN